MIDLRDVTQMLNMTSDMSGRFEGCYLAGRSERCDLGCRHERCDLVVDLTDVI